MAQGEAELIKIARDTRHEFEDRLIAVSYLVEVFRLHRPSIAAGESEQSTRQGIERVLETFPVGACEVTSAVLRDRVGGGNIISGSYGRDDGGHYDFETKRYIDDYFEYGNRPHTFLYVARSPAARGTIVDITADQFGGPSIYVGPWCDPYTESGGSRV